MENKEYKFKTNINCGGCVSSVKPHLDKASGITEWSVDTDNKDKILTVKTSEMSKDDVVNLIQNSGFKAEAIG